MQKEMTLFATVLVLGFAYYFLEGIWLFAGVLCALVPVGMAFGLPYYLKTVKKKRIEEQLPDALFQAASLSSFTPIEKIIELLGLEKTELGSEFRKASKQLSSGASVDEALKEMADSNGSTLLSRALDLVVTGYETGGDLATALTETAEHVNQVLNLERDRAASATVEKLTLLFAGGLIVPFVLGTLVSVVQSLSFVGVEALGLGGATQQLLANAVFGNQVYIVEYALLASVFVAYQEGQLGNAVAYAAVLVPASIFLFFYASGSIAF